MVLFELYETENHPVYQNLAISNGDRQFGFLQSLVAAALEAEQPFLSQTIIKALNFHAIACLHTSAGHYRPCEVHVGNHQPPAQYRVTDLMDSFVNVVNRSWETADPVGLAAYVLWRLNHIHPFINGNGRTARAACYFVLCVKTGGWLPGDIVLPALLVQNRPELVVTLQHADASLAHGAVDLAPLQQLIGRLLLQQLQTPDAAPK